MVLNLRVERGRLRDEGIYRSAKPLFTGSNPVAASIIKTKG